MSIGALARVLAICTLLALLHSPGAAVAQKTPSPCDWKATQATADSWDLSGRLGSTREAFEERFGQPKAGNKSESFPEYEIPGCGTVMASWSTEGFSCH